MTAMIVVDALLLIALSQAPVPGDAATPQSRPPAECADWRACRALALAAADRKENETFHDLAWRAMQKGPAHDPDLMFLVARAQAASKRSMPSCWIAIPRRSKRSSTSFRPRQAAIPATVRC